MGYQLWVSPLTGYRRKGTRFTALKQIFIDNVTARCIYEPLLCCPINSNAEEAKQALKTRDFDVAGVKAIEDGDVIGYVVTNEIGNGNIKEYIKHITTDLLISDSTPLAEIFSVLSDKNFALVVYGNHVTGIITKADINKPPIRVYIFGMVSLFEMHLNSWITYFYRNDSWINEIPEQRLTEARETYNQRKGKNQELSLLECIQLCDKRDLLSKSNEFLRAFDLSRNYFDSFVKKVEKIRNDLAHSQNSIIASLEWTAFVETITSTEKFLIDSDNGVERIAIEGTNFQDLLVYSV
jgi:hypothetical protein